MFKIFLFVVIVMVASVNGGCQQKEPEEVERQAAESGQPKPAAVKKYDNSIEGDDGVRNAIRGYNLSVIDANIQGRYSPKIRKYALKDQVYRATAFIEERRMNDAVMRSKLSELHFKNITTSFDVATVRTHEKWHYDYVDLDGNLIQPMTEMVYELEYKVLRFQNQWMVDEIKELTPPHVRQIAPARPLFD